MLRRRRSRNRPTVHPNGSRSAALVALLQAVVAALTKGLQLALEEHRITSVRNDVVSHRSGHVQAVSFAHYAEPVSRVREEGVSSPAPRSAIKVLMVLARHDLPFFPRGASASCPYAAQAPKPPACA